MKLLFIKEISWFQRYTNADFKISLHVCVQKQHPENFAFLILRILELFTNSRIFISLIISN